MYKHILCPIDGSSTSNCGMVEAISLAKALQANLRFLHIVDTYFPILDANGELNILYLADIQRSQGKKILEVAEERARQYGVSAECIIVESIGERVSKQIIKQVEEWPADVVVMGTHGLRGFARLMMGSDADMVIKQSHVPVLLVKTHS
ncbi:MAG: universal stress protein [Methylotenera sp.]|jgi:nucleotide-binding universal stress UspA family protein|uniref:universal stress protein n=1 Tax=Methylotenera sp. TaxID=2051956 RepID=UPI002726A8D8|nr:universal stress protein [Methylotenera sp.]MDO9151905.1 universal stress protein [Methylotenera sp.]